jgi:prepilin-type N-terminal cleavage/methylation domain-containing protein
VPGLAGASAVKQCVGGPGDESAGPQRVTAGEEEGHAPHGAARRAERGFSLIETMIGLLVLLIVAVGVLPLGLVAIKTSENQGHLMSRVSEYAQDKLEQLIALSYGDATSDTRQFPAPELGGSGLTLGGNADPAAPVAAYVDYLGIDGVLIASANGQPPAGWYYQRVWEVTSPRPNLKQITVTATVRTPALGGIGRTPRATVTALKTFPF